MELYHGSTWKFDKFSTSRSNKENMCGPYIYLSTSHYDSEVNYASINGSDISARLETRTEEIVEEYSENGEEIELTDAYNLAAKELTGGGRYLYKCAIKEGKEFVISKNEYYEVEPLDIEDFENEDDYFEALDQRYEDDEFLCAAQLIQESHTEEFMPSIIDFVMGEISSLDLAHRMREKHFYDDDDELVCGLSILSEILEEVGYKYIRIEKINKSLLQHEYLGAGDTDHYIVLDEDFVEIKDVENLEIA